MIRFPPTPISRAHFVVGSGLAARMAHSAPDAARIVRGAAVGRIVVLNYMLSLEPKTKIQVPVPF